MRYLCWTLMGWLADGSTVRSAVLQVITTPQVMQTVSSNSASSSNSEARPQNGQILSDGAIKLLAMVSDALPKLTAAELVVTCSGSVTTEFAQRFLMEIS